MIKIYKKDDVNLVSSREVYDNINKSPTQYNRWLKHNVYKPGIEGTDFIGNGKPLEEHAGPRRHEVLMTIDFAKGICQVARTTASKKLRAWLLTV